MRSGNGVICDGWIRKVAVCWSVAECRFFKVLGIPVNTLQGVSFLLEELDSIRLEGFRTFTADKRYYRGFCGGKCR